MDVAETKTVSGDPTVPLWVAGAITTGARNPLITLIVVVADPAEELVAVNVTLWSPPWTKLGVHENAATVLEALGVNAAPEGSGAAVRDWIVSASGSPA